MLDDEGTLGHVEEEEEEEEEREEEECWWRGILLPQSPVCENLEGVLFPRIFSDEAMESLGRAAAVSHSSLTLLLSLSPAAFTLFIRLCSSQSFRK